MRGIFLPSQPRNHPDNLLSSHRVHDPGQNQSGHRNEKGPEYFLDLFILPERLDRSIRVRLHRPLDKFRQEHKERQEQDRSADECQAHVGPARQEDPDRGREGSGQDRGHLHLAEPEIMPLLGIGQPLNIRQCRQIKDAERVQHPVPNRVRLFRVGNDAKEENDDRADEQDDGEVGQHQDQPEQDPGPGNSLQ